MLSGCVISDGVPQFYGPWQSDIERAYNSSVTSDRAKQILCSGSITTEHVAEMNKALKSCLANVGITDVSIDGYGSLQITTSSDIPESVVSSHEMACEETSGWYPVVSLYVSMRQNPNKGDFDQLFADCLVRVGLVPKGFTGADVNAEYSGKGNGFADISSSPFFASCYYDPLSTR